MHQSHVSRYSVQLMGTSEWLKGLSTRLLRPRWSLQESAPQTIQGLLGAFSAVEPLCPASRTCQTLNTMWRPREQHGLPWQRHPIC